MEQPEIQASAPDFKLFENTIDEKVYTATVLAHKGQLACQQERKKFVMCRATKVGRSKDPSFCESQAADFLQCYHEMTYYVK